MLRSMPLAMAGNNSGVAHVLSNRVTNPRAFAAATIAGTSGISKVREPGASKKIARVSGRMSAAIPAPTIGS